MRLLKTITHEWREREARAKEKEAAAAPESTIEEDHEMKEIFALAAELSKSMGIEIEIPPEWR